MTIYMCVYLLLYQSLYDITNPIGCDYVDISLCSYQWNW